VRNKLLNMVSVGLLVGLTAACANSNSEMNDAITDNNATQGASAASEIESPLTEYLGLVLGMTDPEGAVHIRQRRAFRSEEITAECMNEKGFDYVPWPQGHWSWTTNEMEDTLRLDDPEWVSQLGYGISFGTTNMRINWGDAPLHEEGDPNREVFESLSNSEQEAWENALGRWGTYNSGDCRRRADAIIEAEQPAALFFSGEFRPLFEAWQEMSWSIASTEPAVQANEDWSNCMADAGQPGFPNQIDAQNSIGEEYFDLRWAERFSETTTAATNPKLADLQNREIDLALADLNCRVDTDYSARMAAARSAVETQFVNDYRSQLAALRDAAEQRGVDWTLWD